ncbi:SDR family NAD(P)-dependent oxidoreductase [Nocardioides humi]|uniref:SDR family oxidoreductase n=1 Tax=Nocardioides humi TaxID=449461 RepID=A0ABN2BIK6_9ACTN|nr:SDR family oxidoreductase [Nocardioides humi]
MQNKTSLITGAGQGIGRAIAQEFVRRGGGHVVVADLDADNGAETVRLLEGLGGTATFVQVDLRNGDQVVQMVHDAADAAGGLDVLVNNAGITDTLLQGQTTIESLTLDTWTAVMDVNLKAMWMATKAAAPLLRASTRNPAVVNAGSVAGMTGYPEHPAYCVSKAAVLQLTRVAAIDLAPDIRVNAFCPATTDTPMRRQFIEAADDKEALDRFLTASHLIPRAGSVEEVANVAAFLAGDESTFLTGTTVAVDGGSLAWRGSHA